MKKFITTFLSKLNKYFSFKMVENLLFRFKYGISVSEIKSKYNISTKDYIILLDNGLNIDDLLKDNINIRFVIGFIKYGLDYKKIKSLLRYDSSYHNDEYYKQCEEDLIKNRKKINITKKYIPPFFVNPYIINDHNYFFKDDGKFTLKQFKMVENFNSKKELNKQWKKNTKQKVDKALELESNIK